MNILAIESSCDETAVAIVRDGREILCDCIASQAEMHEVYGGVVPEIASRKHLELIYQLTDEALRKSGLAREDLDAIAVTYAPGLIGALLVGVNFGKALAFGLGLPLIPVHHVRGHIAANYLAHKDLQPPFVCLCVSGGTSLLVAVHDYTDMEILGSTRDDAAGECFDKVARVLGIGYPGGAPLDRAARDGDPTRFAFPRSKVEGAPLDFSFSGLKTAAVNLIHNLEQKGEEIPLNDLAASFCATVSDMLVPRALQAAAQVGYDTLCLVGGVAANSRVRGDLTRLCAEKGVSLYLPPLSLCGDNGAMIASQAYYEYKAGRRADASLNAYANRDIDKA